MFGRTKKPASTPFTVQVLTTQYLIEGTAEGDTQLYLPQAAEDWSPLILTSVHLKALGRAEAPARSVSQFAVSGNSVIAVIPHKDASQMAQYDSWEEYDQPLSGLFYIGPYVIHGQMMFLRDDRVDSVMPMVDVSITHASPEVALDELRASFILVNTSWMCGYVPE